MNAKLGKLSIGCHVAIWLSWFLFFLWDKFINEVCSEHSLITVFVGCVTLLGLLSGTVLGIVGMARKESPRGYSIFGFLLSTGFLLLWIIALIDSRP